MNIYKYIIYNISISMPTLFLFTWHGILHDERDPGHTGHARHTVHTGQGILYDGLRAGGSAPTRTCKPTIAPAWEVT